jgi:hypothetical protein
MGDSGRAASGVIELLPEKNDSIKSQKLRTCFVIVHVLNLNHDLK